MLQSKKRPRELGVPHDWWRPEQEDAFVRVKDWHEQGGYSVAIEAPTGVGKSAIATALGSVDNVIVTVSNHGLIDQYERRYGFDAIRGKPYYPCVLDTKVESWKKKMGKVPMASDCHFEDMTHCPVAFMCPYLVAKTKALASKRMVCTYKYAALSEAVHNRGGILVMDEVHNSVDDLLSLSQFEMTDDTRKDFKFDRFPLIAFGPKGYGDILDTENREIVMYWITKQMQRIANIDLFDVLTPEGTRNQKMFDRLKEAMGLLSGQDRLFYSCNIPETSRDWRGKKYKEDQEMSMNIRLLEVSSISAKIMRNKETCVFMSATIGNPRPLLNELGVFSFEFVTYPHPVPADKRPIYDLGIGKMTKQEIDQDPSLYLKQAERIADFINSLDHSWRGIVLTTSNYKIELMKRFLTERLNSRIFTYASETGLGERIKAFMNNPKEGLIAIDTIQGWGSGLSLEGDLARISVIAGVPFANPSDRFEKLRMETETGKRYAFWKPYSTVCQATGRVSRGEVDFDGSYMLNVAAFADGSCSTPTAKSQYPAWIRDAIVKWEK